MPDECVVELPDGGERYVLPPHARRKVRIWGTLLILGGLPLAGLFGYMFVRIFPEPFLSVLLGACVVIMLFLVALGLWWALGRHEVVLTREALFGVGRIGSLRWAEWRPLDQLARLVVVSDPQKDSVELVAVCHDGRPLRLVCRQDYERLWHLAADLAAKVAVLHPDLPPVRVEGEWEVWQDARPSQPAYSRVRVTGGPGRVRFDVPAAGPFSPFGLFLVPCGLAIVVAFGWLAWGFDWTRTDTVGLVLMGGVFLLMQALGLGMLIVGLDQMLRRVTLTVAERALTLEQVAWFRRKTWRWAREELAQIAPHRYYVQPQTTPVMAGNVVGMIHTPGYWATALWIAPRQGEGVLLNDQCGLATKCLYAEWEWLATKLREALAL